MTRAGALRACLEILFLGVLTLMLLAEGSVRAEPLHAFSTASYAVAAACLIFVRKTQQTFWPVSIAIAIALILTGVGLFQAGFDFGLARIHPAWRSAAEIIGPVAGTVSIAPADTMAALGSVVLPFMIFAASFVLLDSDRAATRLLAVGVAVAVLGAIIAVIQLEFAPNALLFGTKRYYLDSLTAFFVNRNTSATYLAMQMIVAAGFCVHYAGDLDLKRLVRSFFAADHANARVQKISFSLLASLAAFLILFTALMLTKSRAGVASGLAGLGVLSVLAAYYWPSARISRSIVRSRSQRTSFGRRMARVSAVVVIGVLLASIFAGRALLRAEVRGVEDERFCLYPGMIRLINDNWAFGTGMGTFKTAFLPYRPPQCEVMSIVDRAHNFYLEALIAVGVIAIPLSLIVVFSLAFGFASGLGQRRSMRWAPMVGAGVLTTVLLHAAVDFSLQIPGFAVWFAAVMAAALRISLGRRSSRRARRAYVNSEVIAGG